MLERKIVERLLESALGQGADFADVFVEDSRQSEISLLDRRIERVVDDQSFGVGLRLIFGRGSEQRSVYGYSCDPEEKTLMRLCANLVAMQRDAAPEKHELPPLRARTATDLWHPRHHVLRDPRQAPRGERAEQLRRLDEGVRRQGHAIQQVSASILEKRRSVLICNSEGLWIEDSRPYVRLRLAAVAQAEDGLQSAAESPGALGGMEVLAALDERQLCEEVGRSALRMAKAGYIDGGSMPVILGNGFGGVIFHEACGHPLETEAIRKDASPFVGKIGERVAAPVLTAIDDGTLPNFWGSCQVDDEGMPTQRTVLIEKGILKSYLSDRIGAEQLGIARSGSARRESYRYAPVSRMRNTYIDRGPHRIDDMIASVDRGLYARKMGGGSVDPATGEFNFAVQEGYIIQRGRLGEAVRGATLIGKGHEVLPQISMVADDLSLAAGMCGASSGWVPTTVGQPTLKIDALLVGGR